MTNILKKFNKNSIAVLTSAFTIGIAGLVIATITSNVVVVAATSVDLGTADSFAVLAYSTITNTGPTVITGDLGLSPGTSVTGFPPGLLLGTQYVADTNATQAKAALVTAYNDAAGQTPAGTNSGVISADLAGQTLIPGVYRDNDQPDALSLNGVLTLDAQGDPNAVFIFQSGSSLITGPASSVVLINGAQACNVFWQVTSSATLGTSTTFVGNILALIDITLNTGATVNGRVLARNGAVTLDTNTITRATCAALPASSASSSPKLPKAGIGPEDKSDTLTWSIIIPAGIFAVLFSCYLVQRKQP
jgi:hypothetical protein